MKPEEKRTLKHLLMWIVLLLVVLLPPLIAIGFFGSVQQRKSCPICALRLEGPEWQNQGLQADFCRIAGLTPPGSCDTLATRVAGFLATKSGTFPRSVLF